MVRGEIGRLNKQHWVLVYLGLITIVGCLLFWGQRACDTEVSQARVYYPPKINDDVAEALQKLGLLEFEHHFRVLGVTSASYIPEIKEQDIRELGLPRLQTNRILARLFPTSGPFFEPHSTGVDAPAPDTQHDTIILVTTTVPSRPRYYFTALCMIIRHIPNIYWIVSDFNSKADPVLKSVLEKCPVPTLHIYCLDSFKDEQGRELARSLGNRPPKGNTQTNLAFEYIKTHRMKGIVYYINDDDLVSRDLFALVRRTRFVSTWSVGGFPGGPNADAIPEKYVERPIVNPSTGVLEGWNGYWPTRKFPVSWEGFAFNASLLLPLKSPVFPLGMYGGETEFLETIVKTRSQIECYDAKSVLVWHDGLKTFRNRFADLSRWFPDVFQWFLDDMAFFDYRHPALP